MNQRRGAQAGGYLGILDIVKKAGLGQCGGWPGPSEQGSPEEETSDRHCGRGLGPRSQAAVYAPGRRNKVEICEAEQGILSDQHFLV